MVVSSAVTSTDVNGAGANEEGVEEIDNNVSAVVISSHEPFASVLLISSEVECEDGESEEADNVGEDAVDELSYMKESIISKPLYSSPTFNRNGCCSTMSPSDKPSGPRYVIKKSNGIRA